MDQKPRKGVVPESEPKARKPLTGATVVKGGQVPSEVLRASKPSRAAEVLRSHNKQQDLTVVDTSAPLPSPAPTLPSPPASTPRASKAPARDYTGWDLLGLEMDTDHPLRQREIRKHPITGEVVLVSVGQAAEAGELPTLVPDSRTPAAGSPAPDTKSNQP